MDQEQWAVIRRVFDLATELPIAQQTEFVCNHPDVTEQVKQKVLAMLRVDLQDAVTDDSAKNEPLRNIITHNLNAFIDKRIDLFVGNKIEHFRIIKPLGEGGMGEVFLAERDTEDFSQKVAIKMIQAHKVSAANQQRFKRERQILASLQHNHIAGLVGGGQTEDGQPYIIMEYIDGQSITAFCEQRQLDIKQRLRLFTQVLDAVSYAHQNLVIHRDIKPSNVLVTPQGDVKLLDFGIAKLVEDVSSNEADTITQTSDRAMTVATASPEQILGKPTTVLSDIYGLGALLMQILTHESVFSEFEHNTHALETAILEATPRKPSTRARHSTHQTVRRLATQIDTDLDNIVLKALHKEPTKRYVNAAQFMDDISRYLHHYPVIARPDSRWYTIRKFIQRNPASTMLASIMFIGLVSFTSVITYQSGLIEKERDNAIAKAVVARQTANYLADIFNAADPNVHSGEVFTAKMLLDEALASVESLTLKDPIKVELLLTLSRVYRQIAEYDLSVKLLQQATDLANAQKIPQDEQIRLKVMLLQSQGDLSIFLGDYEQSVLSFEQMLGLLDTQSDTADGNLNLSILDMAYRLFEANHGMATALTYMGDNRGSAIYYERAAEAVKQSDDKQQYYAQSLIGLGHALRGIGELQASKAALQKGIEVTRNQQVKPTLDLAHGLNQLASTLSDLNELDTALEYALEGLQIRRSILPEGHMEIIASSGIVANIYAAQGNFNAALAIRLEGLQALRKSLGEDHPFVGILSGVVGQLYVELREFNVAEQYLLTSLDILSSAYSPEHENVGRYALILAKSYLLDAQHEKANEATERALAIYSGQFERTHPARLEAEILAILAQTGLGSEQVDQRIIDDNLNSLMAEYEQVVGAQSRKFAKVTALVDIISSRTLY